MVLQFRSQPLAKTDAEIIQLFFSNNPTYPHRRFKTVGDLLNHARENGEKHNINSYRSYKNELTSSSLNRESMRQ